VGQDEEPDWEVQPAYSIRAKDNGWVDTKKQGVYVLTPSWKDAIPREPEN